MNAPLEPSSSGPSRANTSTGLAPNVSALLCYVLGFISAIVFLVIETQNRETNRRGGGRR